MSIKDNNIRGLNKFSGQIVTLSNQEVRKVEL